MKLVQDRCSGASSVLFSFLGTSARTQKSNKAKGSRTANNTSTVIIDIMYQSNHQRYLLYPIEAGILGKINRIEVNSKIFINGAMLFFAVLSPDLLLRRIL